MSEKEIERERKKMFSVRSIVYGALVRERERARARERGEMFSSVSISMFSARASK